MGTRTHRLPRLTPTNAVEINRRNSVLIPVWEQLATDQTDPWQFVPRQVFTPYDCLLISVAFVVLSRVGCLWGTGVKFLILLSNLRGLFIGYPPFVFYTWPILKVSRVSKHNFPHHAILLKLFMFCIIRHIFFYFIFLSFIYFKFIFFLSIIKSYNFFLKTNENEFVSSTEN